MFNFNNLNNIYNNFNISYYKNLLSTLDSLVRPHWLRYVVKADKNNRTAAEKRLRSFRKNAAVDW